MWCIWYLQAIKKEILGEDSEGDEDDEDDDEDDDEEDESDEEGAGQAPVGASTQRIQVCCDCFITSHTKLCCFDLRICDCSFQMHSRCGPPMSLPHTGVTVWILALMHQSP